MTLEQTDDETKDRPRPRPDKYLCYNEDMVRAAMRLEPDISSRRNRSHGNGPFGPATRPRNISLLGQDLGERAAEHLQKLKGEQ